MKTKYGKFIALGTTAAIVGFAFVAPHIAGAADDARNSVVHRAAYVSSPQGSNPIALGETGFWSDGVSFYWVAADGSQMSAAPASAPNVYVSSTGSDTNSGTSSSPFATIEHAASLASKHPGLYVINLVGAVTATSPNLWLSDPMGSAAAPVVIQSTMTSLYGTRTASSNDATKATFTDSTLTGIRSASTASIVAGGGTGTMRINVAGYTSADIGSGLQTSGAASAGNNTDWCEIVAVNPGVSVDCINKQAVIPDGNNGAITVTDSLVGARLRCVSGADAGQSRLVRSNTTTALTANTPFGSNISIGDTFVVERPSGSLRYSGSLTITARALGLIDMKIKNAAAASANIGPLGISTTGVMMEGCEMDLATLAGDDAGSVNFINGAQVFAGIFGAPQIRNWGNGGFFGTGSGASSTNKRGSGLFIHNMGTGTSLVVGNGFELNQGARMNGFYVARHGYMVMEDGSSANLKSLDAARVTMLVQAQCELVHVAQVTTFPSVWSGQYVTDTANGLLTMSGTSSGSLDGIGMSNSGGDGVLVSGNSVLQLNAVTGTANALAGMHADRGGRIQIDSAGGSTTLTGTGGDARFGHDTTPAYTAYAALRAVNTQLPLAAFRIIKNVAGHNGAGACTATGLKVGDVVLSVGFAKVPSAAATTQAGLTAFESTVTVADQLQQTGAADLHLEAFDVLVLSTSAAGSLGITDTYGNTIAK